jgi:hypothetical protein
MNEFISTFCLSCMPCFLPILIVTHNTMYRARTTFKIVETVPDE